MSSVKIGSIKSAEMLTRALDRAELIQTKKGGLQVKLTVDNKVIQVSRNQLVKHLLTLEKKDKRPLSDRVADLQKLKGKLAELKTAEDNLNLTAKEKKVLASRQKWGNLFFNRNKKLENTEKLFNAEKKKAKENLKNALKNNKEISGTLKASNKILFDKLDPDLKVKTGTDQKFDEERTGYLTSLRSSLKQMPKAKSLNNQEIDAIINKRLLHRRQDSDKT